MIGYLSGKILSTDEQSLLLDVNGVGYEIFVGNPSDGGFGNTGDELVLWIHTHVREDQISLFGFRDPLQKKIFHILNGITGIGPKLAMSATSQLQPAELVEAVTMGNTKVLRSIPGVGKKMAERMVLELKDKLSTLLKGAAWAQAEVPSGDLAVWNDFHDALSGLGFSDQQIRNVIKLLRKDFEGQQPEINQLLKLGLQKIRQC
jgi:Holliday junction DNA helicase RuvA